MSAWAAAKPSRLSANMVSTELMSFFTTSLPFAAAAARPYSGKPTATFPDHGLRIAVNSLPAGWRSAGAQIPAAPRRPSLFPGASRDQPQEAGRRDRARLGQLTEPARVGARVGAQERLLG